MIWNFEYSVKLIFSLDESEETNSGTPIGQKEDFKEPTNSEFPKKDIFRPYCLPDPDIKPFNSSYNVRIFITFYNLL